MLSREELPLLGGITTKVQKIAMSLPLVTAHLPRALFSPIPAPALSFAICFKVATVVFHFMSKLLCAIESTEWK